MSCGKRGRIETVLANEEGDRVPISAWGHMFDAEWFPEILADRIVADALRFDFDWIKIQNRATAFAEACGAVFVPDPSGRLRPKLGWSPVGSDEPESREGWASVLERLSVDELPSSLAEQVSLVRDVRKAGGDDIPVIQTVFSPIDAIARLLGDRYELAVKAVRENWEMIGPVLRACASMSARFAEESIKAGADGVYYAVSPGFASRRAMPSDEYLDLLLEYDHVVMDGAAGGWFNMLHLCGPDVSFSLSNSIPCHAVSWSTVDDGNPSLVEAASITKRARVSGIHRSRWLRDGRPVDVFGEAENAIKGVDRKGLMLAPGCSVTPWPADRSDNFIALRAVSP